MSELPPKKKQGFASLSPERRRELLAKAAESRRRNAAARLAKKERKPAGARPVPKAQIANYLSLFFATFAGAYDFPATDPSLDPAWEKLDDAGKEEVLRLTIEGERQQREVLALLRSWLPHEDRLSELEVSLVSDAAADELVKRPRLFEPFRTLLAQAQEARLAVVVVLILLPRLTRRGLVPSLVHRVLYPALLVAAGRSPKADGGLRPSVAREPVAQTPSVEDDDAATHKRDDQTFKGPMSDGMTPPVREDG